MRFRLEKINHVKRQRRFYELRVARTLFGDWQLIREWGRIGNAGGQIMTEYLPSRSAAERALRQMKRTKEGRGYVAIPVQLSLFPLMDM